MIVLMGSGETSPTMVELHKQLLRGRGHVTVLDTPYGFQENADELSERALTYFRDSVGATASVASLRTADAPGHEVGAALAALREARYVFSGPGSPTYALRQWQQVGMVDVFAHVVAEGGVVCLASAASVCSGEKAIPVYEIYKVGLAPHWEQGLDVLARIGLRAAVVPHFNNAEGGTHDTSCCWIGRRRLDLLRAAAPDLPVLGIDEHTAVVIDPATGRATVHGQGQAYVLTGDETAVFAAGSALDLGELLGTTAAVTVAEEAAQDHDLEHALRHHDAHGVVAALSHGADPATATALAALSPVLEKGWARPQLALLLEARAQARTDKQWALSDLLRDGLAALGCVVEDTPSGQQVRDGKN